MRLSKLAILFVILAETFAIQLQGADLVRIVRNKISAGDIASGMAAAEDYKSTTGVDEEYLNALGWLARGAELLGRRELAESLVADLHRAIPAENETHLTPYGAAIEVEGRIIASRDGRGAAITYYRHALERAKDVALRSRIQKNINLLSLEGQPAPRFGDDAIVSATKGQPVLLFLWASWCGDCKAQGASLARVWQKYRGKGVAMVAPTRLYGSVDDKDASPADESAHVKKVWKESYPGLGDVSVVIDTETMERYGASATPTLVLIDRAGIVRLYAPTRLSEAELSRRIDAVMGEP